ncbi:cutinase-domain-containing protein [Xylariales sp. PMI_506]|nr:cutinase-domain-containing protein [Xylariales sp. PMI_506]
MRFPVAIIISSVLVAATNAVSLGADNVEHQLDPRTALISTTTSNEIIDGDGCEDVVLIFARGTLQPGNIGDMPAILLSNGLIEAVSGGSVSVQGVNYPAGLLTNLDPGGCSATDAAGMAKMITNVTTACPSSQIVVAGYSQGAAMVHASISMLTAAEQERITAAVTFGDTQAEQTDFTIGSLPASKVKIFCNSGDLVCDGVLLITTAHLNYNTSVPDAVSFITSLL